MKNHSSGFSQRTLIPARPIGSGRGQASIEFILVLVFMLVVVSGIMLPLGQRMQSALEDVSLVGSVSAGMARIEGDVGLLTSVPGNGLKSLSIFLPKGTRLLCDPLTNTISATVPLNRDVFGVTGEVPPSCSDISSPGEGQPQMICTRSFALPANVDLVCQGSASNSFSVDTGAAGFTQLFRVGTVYSASGSPPFTVDFSSG